MPSSEIKGNCGSFPLPPADHARGTLSHLANAGGAAPAAPSCRVLGRDSDEVSGHHAEHLVMAAAGQMFSQGSATAYGAWLQCPFLFFFANP